MNHDGTTDTTTGDGGDQQRWIDELLRSSAAAELETAPAGAKFATAAAIGKLRRRRRRQSLAVLAAAAVAAVWAWPNPPLPGREGSGEGFSAPVIAQSPVQSPNVENPSPSPSFRGRGIFVANGDAIAVELESPAPEVTAVQLHPTTIAQRRAENELVIQQLLTTEPNGG